MVELAQTQRAADRSVSEQVLGALRRISRAVDLHSRVLVHRYGLTGPQLMLLGELTRAGEMSTGELAHAVSLSQATVTGILDRLERRGLIVRQRSTADKRRVLVRPTEACRALLAAAPPMLHEAFVDQFAGLADWEQTQILASVQRLAAMMEAGVKESGPVAEWTSGPEAGAIEPSSHPAAEGAEVALSRLAAAPSPRLSAQTRRGRRG